MKGEMRNVKREVPVRVARGASLIIHRSFLFIR